MYLGRQIADYPATMGAGQSAVVELVVHNEGARAWDTSTKLGTTEPRDRTSPFAGQLWENDHRAAAVDAAVANNESTTLTFTITAPLQTGPYTEHFNLVQESVAWFSDTPPGGGPNDDEIALNITVTTDGGAGGFGTGGSGPAGGGGDDGSAAHGIPNTGLHGSCAFVSRPAGRAVGWWRLGWLALVVVPAWRRRGSGRRARDRAL